MFPRRSRTAPEQTIQNDTGNTRSTPVRSHTWSIRTVFEDRARASNASSDNPASGSNQQLSERRNRISSLHQTFNHHTNQLDSNRQYFSGLRNDFEYEYKTAYENAESYKTVLDENPNKEDALLHYNRNITKIGSLREELDEHINEFEQLDQTLDHDFEWLQDNYRYSSGLRDSDNDFVEEYMQAHDHAIGVRGSYNLDYYREAVSTVSSLSTELRGHLRRNSYSTTATVNHNDYPSQYDPPDEWILDNIDPE